MSERASTVGRGSEAAQFGEQRAAKTAAKICTITAQGTGGCDLLCTVLGCKGRRRSLSRALSERCCLVNDSNDPVSSGVHRMGSAKES